MEDVCKRQINKIRHNHLSRKLIMAAETTQEVAPKEQEQPKQETSISKSVKYTPELCAATISKLPAQLQGLKNCFAQPFDAFRKSFKDPAEADRIMAKEIDFAAQAMMSNNYLISCATKNPMSLVNALKNVAQTGSTLNPVLKQGYLVPFGGAVTFMPSYMGLIDALASTGVVKKIEAHPVFKGEPFKITFGSNGGLFHEPNPWGDRKKENLCGCYWYAVLVDGTEQFDTLSFEEVEAIRKRAPSAKSSSPWDTDYIEMLCKTAIRRGYKKLPKKGVSEDKIKTLEAIFDYDEKAEQSWIAEQKNAPKRDTFDEEEVEYTEFEESK